MSTVYLLNTPIITAFGLWRFTGPLSLDEVRGYLDKGFISSIGHPATADFLSALLAMDCPFSRSRIAMQTGDVAIVFQLLGRLPEGKLLDAHEISSVPYQFGLLRCEMASQTNPVLISKNLPPSLFSYAEGGRIVATREPNP